MLMMVLFSLLSPLIEVPTEITAPNRRFGVQRSRGIVKKLAALFSLDAFAGGLIVQSIIAYWFYLRHGSESAAAYFSEAICSPRSRSCVHPIARRFGLLKTMKFSHLPSNVLLRPFMPTLESAVTMLLTRNLLSPLDVPTRQSYTMVVVHPEERAASADILSVSRNTGAAIAPLFTAFTLVNPMLGMPFLLAGGLKIVYDLWIFTVFQNLRPPEEESAIRVPRGPMRDPDTLFYLKPLVRL